MDNALALRQMSTAFEELGARTPADPREREAGRGPRLITLGGDHSLSLPALRALVKVHGPVRVLHFDAHLDTWHPAKYPSAWPSEQAHFNHGSSKFSFGTFTPLPTRLPGYRQANVLDWRPANRGAVFWLAGQEGLLANSSAKPSVHAGLRTRLSGDDYGDWEDDSAQNWVRLGGGDEMDDTGAAAVAGRIMEALGTEDPVYLSVDIDVLDPAFAPGTGTPEPGGWSTRELIRVLRAVEGLNLVGADVVEVAPAYQGAGEETALAAAQVVYEVLSSMVKRGAREEGRGVPAAETPAGVDAKEEL